MTKIIESITKNADNSLQEVVNFLMWTSAFAFAIIAWFTTQLKPTLLIENWLGVLGLVLIIDSFIVSIYTIGEILKYREWTWRSLNRLYQVLLFLNVRTGETASETIETVTAILTSSMSDAKKRNDWVERFPIQSMVIIHLILLGIGLVFYSLTVFL
jgi:hypothetical protein